MKLKPNLGWLAVFGCILGAAWLRWQFIARVYPYPDEFVTLLAVKQITKTGLPILPSGLFYEHGFLFSYLGACVSLIFGFSQTTVRLFSLMCGLTTVGLLWYLGKRWFSNSVGILAACFLAIYPSAVQWGGRARMYSLLHLLILLSIFFLFERVRRGQTHWKVLVVSSFFLAGLAHFLAMALVPPLIISALGLAWLIHRPQKLRIVWYDLLEIGAWGVAIGGAFLLKRAGQPKGIEPLEANTAAVSSGIWQVLAIYSDISFDLLGNWASIGPFYTDSPARYLSILAIIGLGFSLFRLKQANFAPVSLFLGSIMFITTLEILFLVAPDRRDDKYLFMLVPLLCLLAAVGLWQLSQLWPKGQFVTQAFGGLILLGLIWPSTQALWYHTGEDYASAFDYVQQNWQEGDQVLTGTPAAAALYLGRNDFYAVRGTQGYAYRLLTVDGQQVDRWLGSPWLETDEQLQAALAGPNRVWLVLERWGLIKEYYSPLTMQRLLAMTDFVREDSGIIVLQSRPGATLIPIEAETPTEHNFDYKLWLTGYTLDQSTSDSLDLTLQWKVLNTLPRNYSMFVHVRDANGNNIAQQDWQALSPVYPTTLWPVDEIIRERVTIALPTAPPVTSYHIWLGVYNLETLTRLPVINDTSGENAVLLTKIQIER